MKKPDEIKKGLRCLAHDRTHTLPCSDCEYHGQGLPPCRTAVHEDAIALIQQLQHNNAQLAIDKAKLAEDNAEQAEKIKQLEDHLREATKKVKQLEAERDETISVLRYAGCDTCKYREVYSWEEPCIFCMEHERWQWCGVQKEDSDDGKE